MQVGSHLEEHPELRIHQLGVLQLELRYIRLVTVRVVTSSFRLFDLADAIVA